MLKKRRSLIDPGDFTVDELYSLLKLADNILKQPEKYSHACDGKLMASLFYEPSTRTKFSFDAAMNRLGGRVLGFADPSTTSAAKGETLADSAKIVSQYVDLIVLRHPKEGTALHFSRHADCPVINAGDGGHQHPTQTLTDLLTIKSYKNRLTDLKIGLCGDLKFGRTIHSLVTCMSRFENISFVFISPDELKMPSYVTDILDEKGIPYTETDDLESSMADLDVLYMSRVQRERFVSEEEYERLKDVYILTNEKLKYAKDDMIILHPLPRVNEISPEVDKDPRAVYFHQARYGMFIRMALIMTLLGFNEEVSPYA
ncbi:MAG: aspartate carbamoyltransferase [Clostridia bacterium]|nr:aspartate carbamoyltransferase [Clostridia bacterium]